MPEFGILNWSILISYIIANLALGYVLSKRIKSLKGFFLGNRATPWWVIGVSVVATYVSAMSFLGAPAWSYTDGMSVVLIHLSYPLAIILVNTLFLPFFYNTGIVSIYEYQEQRFGPTSRMVMSGIFLLSQSVVAAAILYATSLVLQFITGIDVIYSIFIVTLIALIYTALGGITAVIWTDVIQGAVLFLGVGIILYTLLTNLPMTLHETLIQLKVAGKTDPFDFSFDYTKVTTVWSAIVAMTLYNVTVYGVNQVMVQRTLAAKTMGDAKKSYLTMGFASFFIYFVFTLLGILFYSYYEGREFENGNIIILQFAAEYGLPGLMGILTAAIMAASMSTLDSFFNSASTVTVVDFYQKYFCKNASDEHYLIASRWFMLFWAVMIILPALMFSKTEGSIFEILFKVTSYFFGAKLAMYGMGFFSKHTTEKGLLIGVVANFAVVWIVAATTDTAWPWFTLIGALTNILISLPASLLIDGPQQEWSRYSVPGQIKKFREEGLSEKVDGWYVVPGRVDKINYVLFAFFCACLLFLYFFNAMI